MASEQKTHLKRETKDYYFFNNMDGSYDWFAAFRITASSREEVKRILLTNEKCRKYLLKVYSLDPEEDNEYGSYFLDCGLCEMKKEKDTTEADYEKYVISYYEEVDLLDDIAKHYEECKMGIDFFEDEKKFLEYFKSWDYFSSLKTLVSVEGNCEIHTNSGILVSIQSDIKELIIGEYRKNVPGLISSIFDPNIFRVIKPFV